MCVVVFLFFFLKKRHTHTHTRNFNIIGKLYRRRRGKSFKKIYMHIIRRILSEGRYIQILNIKIYVLSLLWIYRPRRLPEIAVSQNFALTQNLSEVIPSTIATRTLVISFKT